MRARLTALFLTSLMVLPVVAAEPLTTDPLNDQELTVLGRAVSTPGDGPCAAPGLDMVAADATRIDRGGVPFLDVVMTMAAPVAPDLACDPGEDVGGQPLASVVLTIGTATVPTSPLSSGSQDVDAIATMRVTWQDPAQADVCLERGAPEQGHQDRFVGADETGCIDANVLWDGDRLTFSVPLLHHVTDEAPSGDKPLFPLLGDQSEPTVTWDDLTGRELGLHLETSALLVPADGDILAAQEDGVTLRDVVGPWTVET